MVARLHFLNLIRRAKASTFQQLTLMALIQCTPVVLARIQLGFLTVQEWLFSMYSMSLQFSRQWMSTDQTRGRPMMSDGKLIDFSFDWTHDSARVAIASTDEGAHKMNPPMLMVQTVHLLLTYLCTTQTSKDDSKIFFIGSDDIESDDYVLYSVNTDGSNHRE